MAVSDENGALFPIFILSTIALPLVPYTILKLINAASQKPKSILCECSVCSRSGKYRQSTAKKVVHSSQSWLYLLIWLCWLKVLLRDGNFCLCCLLLQFSNFFTCHNFTLALLWIFMGFLVYYIKNMSREVSRYYILFTLNSEITVYLLLSMKCTVVLYPNGYTLYPREKNSFWRPFTLIWSD